MNEHYRDIRKIEPNRGDRLGDGSPNDNNRIEIGPTQLAFREWEVAGLALPDLGAMRSFRLQRLVDAIVARDLGGLLLFDPLNIRYATDSTNMQLWNTHNPFRAALICPDGYLVLWEYKNSPFLADHNPLVREVRSGASMFYFVNGDRNDAAAKEFADQISEVMATHAGGNARLAID